MVITFHIVAHREFWWEKSELNTASTIIAFPDFIEDKEADLALLVRRTTSSSMPSHSRKVKIQNLQFTPQGIFIPFSYL